LFYKDNKKVSNSQKIAHLSFLEKCVLQLWKVANRLNIAHWGNENIGFTSQKNRFYNVKAKFSLSFSNAIFIKTIEASTSI